MGEVKVRTRLTNALDEELARQGQLSGDQVRFYEAHAVVDTGAVRRFSPCMSSSNSDSRFAANVSPNMLTGGKT